MTKEMEPASINEIKGNGCAEIIRENEQSKYVGRFRFNNGDDALTLAVNYDPLFYTGVVYDDENVYTLTFEIVFKETITYHARSNLPKVVEFTSREIQ